MVQAQVYATLLCSCVLILSITLHHFFCQSAVGLMHLNSFVCTWQLLSTEGSDPALSIPILASLRTDGGLNFNILRIGTDINCEA